MPCHKAPPHDPVCCLFLRSRVLKGSSLRLKNLATSPLRGEVSLWERMDYLMEKFNWSGQLAHFVCVLFLLLCWTGICDTFQLCTPLCVCNPLSVLWVKFWSILSLKLTFMLWWSCVVALFIPLQAHGGIRSFSVHRKQILSGQPIEQLLRVQATTKILYYSAYIHFSSMHIAY